MISRHLAGPWLPKYLCSARRSFHLHPSTLAIEIGEATYDAANGPCSLA